jgi:small GTP-binding protein
MFACFGPKYKQKHAIIIGLENAGKTSLLYRTKFDGYSDIIYTEPTIGFNREQITFNDYKVQLTCTDLPGVEGLRTIWPHFITNDIDGLVFVIDAHQVLTDVEYLLDCKDVFWKTLDESRELDTCPVIIFLNKMDKAKNVINKMNKMFARSQNEHDKQNEFDEEFGRNFEEHFGNKNGFDISQWFSHEFELDQLSWRSYLVQPCSTKRSNPKVMHGMRWLISKMVSKTQGKDKPFNNEKQGNVNLSRRDSTHVVTRRHKKYKPKPIYQEPSIILKREYFEPCVAENETVVESVESVESIPESVPNIHQNIDNRLSELFIHGTNSRLGYHDNRRRKLERDFSSDDQMSFVPGIRRTTPRKNAQNFAYETVMNSKRHNPNGYTNKTHRRPAEVPKLNFPEGARAKIKVKPGKGQSCKPGDFATNCT